MAAADFGVGQLPSAVLFDDGVPEVFPGDVLDPLQLREWVAREVRREDVEVVDAAVLASVARRASALAAVFVEDANDLPPVVEELAVLCDSLDVSLAVVPGRDQAAKLGVGDLPALAYFEDGVPSLYGGSVSDDVPAALEWVEDQRTADTIERVTEQMLAQLATEKEYLAVFFTGPCDERAKTDQECTRVLRELEKIDDELDAYGIPLVTTQGVKYAGIELGLRRFPCLGIFRNGHFLAFNGSSMLGEERAVLTWLLDKDTLELKGQVEEVGAAMLDRLAHDEEHLVLMAYRDVADKHTQVIARPNE
jgi:hypothetical protein